MKTSSEKENGQFRLHSIPAHVAIIMDGNGRWAQKRGLSRLEGHRAGTQNIRLVTETFNDYGVECVTLFAFSTENWARPSPEVDGLFQILQEVISEESQNLHEKGVRLCHLGRLERLPKLLQKRITAALELTKNNTNIVLNLAFDYGGRDEILAAVRRIAAEHIQPEAVDENLFRQYLYMPELPDADLIIRTGGEMRLSNFLMWQSAYSELFFTPVLWPDFGKKEIENALAAYGNRERRFGKLGLAQATSHT